MPKHILIVDDEESLIFAFRRQIQSPTVAVDGAATVDETLALLEARRYDAVVVDLRLGGTGNRDGLDLIRHVTKQYPETQTVLLTAYGSHKVREQASQAGASLYLEKPITGRTLRDRLRQLVLE